MIADDGRMHDDAVADGDAAPDRHGLSRIGVKDAMILHVRVLAHSDDLIVAAQHGAEPDARTFQYTDFADQNGIRRNKAAIGICGWAPIRRG